MDIVSADSDVARTIAACNEQMWQAYLEKNVVRHNAILSDDYTAIHPDGSLHNGAVHQNSAASSLEVVLPHSRFLASRCERK